MRHLHVIAAITDARPYLGRGEALDVHVPVDHERRENVSHAGPNLFRLRRGNVDDAAGTHPVHGAATAVVVPAGEKEDDDEEDGMIDG